MIQLSQNIRIYCPYCNNKLKDDSYSDMILELCCESCDINISFYDKEEDPYIIIINYQNYPEKCYLVIDYYYNETYYSYFDKNNKAIQHELPKALPLNYVISNSKDKILNKVKTLLAFS